MRKKGPKDSLDTRLIELLQEDAHRSSEELARHLKVSTSTVRRRIRQLIASGVMHIVAVVDPGKVGFPLCAMIALDVAHEKLDSVLKLLASRHEVMWVSSTTGRFDIIAHARFRSTEELSNFVEKELANLEGLRDSETFICLRVSKGNYIQV